MCWCKPHTRMTIGGYVFLPENRGGFRAPDFDSCPMTPMKVIFVTTKTKPPDHLAPATRAWFAQVVADYALEPHHLKLLTLAAESWDRCVEARLSLAEHGLVYSDRWGSPRCRPEVAVERDSRIAFARLCRELDLNEDATPLPARPPALHSNRRT